jgi:alpha-1,3-mannosyltransferase
MALYIGSGRMPPWTLTLLCLSRRLHSIFVLRLFNDCWATMFALLATYMLQRQHWALSIVLYSAGVAVKMNVLLVAPGVLAIVLQVRISCCVYFFFYFDSSSSLYNLLFQCFG